MQLNAPITKKAPELLLRLDFVGPPEYEYDKSLEGIFTQSINTFMISKH